MLMMKLGRCDENGWGMGSEYRKLDILNESSSIMEASGQGVWEHPEKFGEEE